MKKPGPGARRRARRAALQGLYQWQATGQPAEEIIAQFDDEKACGNLDRDYFCRIIHGVIINVESLDEMLTPCLDRPLKQVDPVERAVLRLAAFELSHCEDVPWRVIIDESVELARAFGAEQGHRFINGVLDKLAPSIRAEAKTGAGG
ncbi:MAG TPA: transcription antitermination factor NusB [Gammaproteobacteria bacterium]|nr:transcription antitermination factor NusB [Gammaproteobacteria bacterium]